MTVPFQTQQAWSVIEDYDELHRFMPNLRSRTLELKKDRRVVEQIAASSFVPVLKFRLTLEFKRSGNEWLSFRRIAGSLPKFDGVWAVTPVAQGSKVSYRLQAEHCYPLPAFMLSFAIRTDTEKIMPAIAGELQRRYPWPNFSGS